MIKKKKGKSSFKKIQKKYYSYLTEKNHMALRSEFLCSICKDILVYSRIIGCLHTFCRLCINEWIIHNNSCPVCDQRLSLNLIPCENLDRIIQNFIGMNSTLQSNYTKRCDEALKFLNDQKFSCDLLKPGNKIDVRDTENIWTVGTIEDMDFTSSSWYKISYDGWSEEYTEVIPSTSDRYARLGFYTKRKDIPRYVAKKGKRTFTKQLFIPKSGGGYSKLILNQDTEARTCEEYYQQENTKIST